MADVVVTLFAGFTSGTTVDSASSIDIQDDGFIEGIFMNVSASGADALNDEAAMEVSFGSTNTFSKNDIRVSICGMRTRQAFLTSGGGPVGGAVYVPVNLRVNAGERIHLHVTSSSGVTGEALAYMYLMATGRQRRARRRR